MENKKYLDKILEYMVRHTKIDYENEEVYLHFLSSRDTAFSLPNFLFHHDTFLNSRFYFSNYCISQFGLTQEEVKYMWEDYQDIIKEKIKNGEQ